MFELTFYQRANALKGYLLAIGVAFAIYMVANWWRRSQIGHRTTREAQAERVCSSYLLQAMQHPELARAAARAVPVVRRLPAERVGGGPAD